MRILVVDDDMVSREKLGLILSSVGQCETVDSGKNALVIFEEHLSLGKNFDIITLDVSMPEMDGTEVLFEMKVLEKDYHSQNVSSAKILMVSCLSDRDTVMTCIQAGCDGYLIKPFNKQSIFKQLAKIGVY
ncbi:MAG: hypothetical protein COB67_13270 [SAR324 cluster bacterium]|uniref:Response regulatory domain-containing protein n=1 Tax=SAR324 cluster bacterium TaxID=2024889 RepID=A0A2A4SNP9_9DELT|nr:MAG: hypothetical protein COB67_13270 [SAR324 cluster bacterium]